MHTTVDIERPMPPDTYPPVHAKQGQVSPLATGIAGVIGGALVGAGFMASRKMGEAPPSGEKGSGKEA
jgi:hypothetical protein